MVEAEGFEPLVDGARSVASRLIEESLCPANCGAAVGKGFSLARKVTSALPLWSQTILSHWLDAAQARLDTPGMAAEISSDLTDWALVFMRRPT